jgi:hypothetical protein
VSGGSSEDSRLLDGGGSDMVNARGSDRAEVFPCMRSRVVVEILEFLVVRSAIATKQMVVRGREVRLLYASRTGTGR